MSNKLPRDLGKSSNDPRWNNASPGEILNLMSEYNKNKSWYDPDEWKHYYTEKGMMEIQKDAIEQSQSRMDSNSTGR